MNIFAYGRTLFNGKALAQTPRGKGRRAAYWLSTLLLLATLSGCGLYDPTPPDDFEAEEQGPVVADEPLPLTVGDVESKVYMEAGVAESSQAPNIDVDTLSSRNERIQLRTINVAAPYPERLICEFHLVSEQNFPDTPVAIVGRIQRDAETIGAFDAVLGEEAVRRLAENPDALPSLHFEFDVLEGLEAIPETMLVVAEMDAKLTPVGTEEAGLDPATVEVRSANQTILRSNPLRINFLPAPEALEDASDDPELREEASDEAVEPVQEPAEAQEQE